VKKTPLKQYTTTELLCEILKGATYMCMPILRKPPTLIEVVLNTEIAIVLILILILIET
jgi:hypothetical protein